MTEEVVVGKVGGFLSSARVKIAGLAATGMGLVASASATVDINGTVGPVIDSFAEVIPSIINLILALVPALIVMAIVGLIISVCDGLGSKFKF